MHMPLACAPSDLTEKQREFTKLVGDGVQPIRAAEVAGYSQYAQEAWRLMQLPHIVERIKLERTRTMVGKIGALAMNAVEDILTAEDTPKMVKFQCAKWVLEVNGHVPQTAKNLGLALSDKPLTEMTPEELRAFVDTGRKALEVIENTATNVTPVVEEKRADKE